VTLKAEIKIKIDVFKDLDSSLTNQTFTQVWINAIHNIR